MNGIDWDVVLLGALTVEIKENFRGCIYGVKRFTGMHSYLVNKRKVERILTDLIGGEDLVDWAMSDAITNGLKVFVTLPFLSGISASKSDITAEGCSGDFLAKVSRICESRIVCESSLFN
jgi:hypothetical protein